MKSLREFEAHQIDNTELTQLQGGANPIKDWLIGEVIGAVVDFIAYDNEGYGRRMYENGSPGGHK